MTKMEFSNGNIRIVCNGGHDPETARLLRGLADLIYPGNAEFLPEVPWAKADDFLPSIPWKHPKAKAG